MAAVQHEEDKWSQTWNPNGDLEKICTVAHFATAPTAVEDQTVHAVMHVAWAGRDSTEGIGTSGGAQGTR